MKDDLSAVVETARLDLLPRLTQFDAIVCAGDHHGIALAAAIAADLGKPLMIVCPQPHGEVVSHITMIGECRPDMRYLYVDDMFAFGKSLAFVFEYMNQSRPSPIVATYEVMTRHFDYTVPGRFGRDANGAITYSRGD